MAINTVLFDLDGTLINTNDLILSSFKHTLDHYFPNQFSEEDIKKMIGEPLYQSFERLDRERAGEMVKMYRRHNMQFHNSLVKEYDGVFETVQTLQRQGIKLGIVTTKLRKTVDMGLRLTKLDPFFDVVITLDDVDRAKPHPEPVQKAMKKLDAVPKETMMVGDSQFDIMAGKSAGTYTAGVAWSIKGKEFLASYQPDFMLHHMSELLDVVGVKTT